MNNSETVQVLMDSVQKGNFERARTMLADDFQLSGLVSEPINAETWLGMGASLGMAFTNLNYHFKVDSSEGDVVNTTSQLSGTNSGALDLTGLRMGVISATNRKFSTVQENTKITFKDEKVKSWAIEPTEGAGLKAMLGQLGVALPTAYTASKTARHK
jgi:hypothetical protein